MITLLQEGTYRLIETKRQTKILTIDNKQTYAWVNARDIGEILVATHQQHKTDCILAIGKYKLYDVKKEPNYADLHHLELSVGGNKWQGYLLLSGLPSEEKKKNRIIPTHEVITKSKKKYIN